MEQSKKHIRNSNIELLRILAIILIITHHYAVHGFSNFNQYYSINKYVLDILSLGGKLGVNIFFIISGYYMINNKFTLKKFLKLAGEVWFYSVLTLILFKTVLVPVDKIEIATIIKCFFPITYEMNWFITAYILLMLFSPYINSLISNISKKSYIKLLLLLLIFQSILPFFFQAKTNTYVFDFSIFCYFIGGFIKKYYINNNHQKYLLNSIAFILVSILGVITTNFIGYRFNISFIAIQPTYFATATSPFLLLSAINLFLYFINLPEKNVSLINLISKSTLGVYLIHDNIITRKFLWINIFKCPYIYSSNYLIIHAISSIFITYIVCVIIDLIRQNTIEILYSKFIDKFINNFENIFNNFNNKLINKIENII